MEAYHDRYQIEEISHNVYHCKYEIRKIMTESVSLYTFKWEFSRTPHALYTHIAGKRILSGVSELSRKRAKILRFRWQASQKCTFLLLSGVPEPHMPPSGGRMSGDDNIVTAAKVDYRQRCRNSKLSKEGLLSKQNTICILK